MHGKGFNHLRRLPRYSINDVKDNRFRLFLITYKLDKCVKLIKNIVDFDITLEELIQVYKGDGKQELTRYLIGLEINVVMANRVIYGIMMVLQNIEKNRKELQPGINKSKPNDPDNANKKNKKSPNIFIDVQRGIFEINRGVNENNEDDDVKSTNFRNKNQKYATINNNNRKYSKKISYNNNNNKTNNIKRSIGQPQRMKHIHNELKQINDIKNEIVTENVDSSNIVIKNEPKANPDSYQDTNNFSINRKRKREFYTNAEEQFIRKRIRSGVHPDEIAELYLKQKSFNKRTAGAVSSKARRTLTKMIHEEGFDPASSSNE